MLLSLNGELQAAQTALGNTGVAEITPCAAKAEFQQTSGQGGWARGSAGGRWQLFPVTLRQPLPVIPVPLREGDAEARLDLQFALNQACDGGPYRRGAVDYSRPPHPPLNNDDASWARELLDKPANAN